MDHSIWRTVLKSIRCNGAAPLIKINQGFRRLYCEGSNVPQLGLRPCKIYWCQPGNPEKFEWETYIELSRHHLASGHEHDRALHCPWNNILGAQANREENET